MEPISAYQKLRAAHTIVVILLFALLHLFPASRMSANGIDTSYTFESVSGKTIGVWPDVWTVERLTQLRTRYGFNYVVVPALRSEYNAARQAGFAPANILVAFWYGYATTAVDSFESSMYYVDEAVEHNCAGQPSAGRIHTPQELAAIRDYVHQRRPSARFVSGGYKRCSHFRILGQYVDNIMFTSYVNWTEFSIAFCNPNLGWGDEWERPFLVGNSDQGQSWTEMRDIFGGKFTMTWIRGREDEYSTLLPLANSLGLSGLWVYHGEAIDTTRLMNFCTAAWQNGWMTRTAQPLAVQLSSFTARRVSGQEVILNWRTLSEMNNFGFYVERRLTGAQLFSEVPNSFTPGQGTTSEPHDYSFTDHFATNEVLQYRLRQVDLDGTIHYSEPIHITTTSSIEEVIPLTLELSQNYPNPFNPSTKIMFQVPSSGFVILEVFDVLGKHIVTLVNGQTKQGFHELVFDAHNLPGGVYFYRMKFQQSTLTRKLILLR